MRSKWPRPQSVAILMPVRGKKMLLLCRDKEYTEGRKLSMYGHNESTSESEINTHIIDYSGLVDTVQLSTARLLDIQGALEAHSFAEVLANQSPEDSERIIWEVGGHFDEALISFITSALIIQRHRQVVILAEASEGVNGGLPWQPKLEQRLHMLQEYGHLRDVQVKVERYSTEDIDSLTHQAQALALDSTPTI